MLKKVLVKFIGACDDSYSGAVAVGEVVPCYKEILTEEGARHLGVGAVAGDIVYYGVNVAVLFWEEEVEEIA